MGFVSVVRNERMGLRRLVMGFRNVVTKWDSLAMNLLSFELLGVWGRLK
jgi:hypothetical protein